MPHQVMRRNIKSVEAYLTADDTTTPRVLVTAPTFARAEWCMPHRVIQLDASADDGSRVHG
jgi:hypothetical protein